VTIFSQVFPEVLHQIQFQEDGDEKMSSNLLLIVFKKDRAYFILLDLNVSGL